MNHVLVVVVVVQISSWRSKKGDQSEGWREDDEELAFSPSYDA